MIISIDENIIQIYNYQNIKFFNENLVNILQEACKNICRSKRQQLVFVIAISSLEHHLLFAYFANSYPIIYINKVELDKLSSSIQFV